MFIKRSGKCSDCRQPCIECKEFLVTIDMFDPTPKTYLKGPLLKEIRAWRKTKLFCGGDACNKSISDVR